MFLPHNQAVFTSEQLAPFRFLSCPTLPTYSLNVASHHCVFDTWCCGHILIGTKVQHQETETSSQLDQLLDLILSFLFSSTELEAQSWSCAVLLCVLYHFLIWKKWHPTSLLKLQQHTDMMCWMSSLLCGWQRVLLWTVFSTYFKSNQQVL